MYVDLEKNDKRKKPELVEELDPRIRSVEDPFYLAIGKKRYHLKRIDDGEMTIEDAVKNEVIYLIMK